MRRIFVIAGIVLVALFVSCGVIVYSGNWLLQGADRPAQAQAIIILAGDLSRSFYAADLYRQRYAPDVYISRPIRLPSLALLDKLGVTYPREEEINKQVLQKKGVPSEHIHFFGRSSISTTEEAQELHKIFSQTGQTILIVTSPYHVRRTKMIFRDAFKGSIIRVVPTIYETFPKQWWTTEDSSRTVVTELVKIIFYKLGGHFHS
jgi:uncharacterized SAM-binding protein YcdF (DUF218 family)